MGIFDELLKSDETIFSNEFALDYDFIPKILPFRENQQKYIAQVIAPLLKERNASNLFIYGSPGIGKTAAIKWISREIEETSDEVIPIYINCWQKNTTYKIVLSICEQIGYRFTQNKKTDDLFKIVQEILNKKAAVFAFDEVDKLEDFDFIYTLIENIYKKSILLITNYKEWLIHLDERIKSRLTADTLEFKPYSAAETENILSERKKVAFYEGVWDKEAFQLIVEKAYNLKDIRQGIYLLRETGMIAESHSSRKVLSEHAKKAISKIEQFSVKNSSDLEEDSRLVLEIIKSNSGKKIGDLYKKYREKNGKNTSKTFQRKVEKLEKAGFITTKKTGGGKEGNTTLVSYLKNLNNF